MEIKDPTSVLINASEDLYKDYIIRVTKTNVHTNFMPRVFLEKQLNWNLDKEILRFNIFRVIYASYLELFLNDGLVDSYFGLFSEYVLETYNETPHMYFRDTDFNSIFHYDAINGKNRTKLYKRMNENYLNSVQEKIGISDEMFKKDILINKNYNKVSVKNIINGNKLI